MRQTTETAGAAATGGRGAAGELWTRVARALDADDADAVAAAVGGLDDARRRGLAGPLRAYGKRWRAELRVIESGEWSHRRWLSHHHRIPALLVAGAGCLTGAEAVARWLTGWPESTHAHSRDELIFPLLAERPAAWQADIAARLAGRLAIRTTPGSIAWQDGIVALVVATGVTPPATPAFLLAWLRSATQHSSTGGVPAAALAADPLLTPMVDALFAADGTGWLLEDSLLAPALCQLAATGVVPRETLIDGCLRRLLRGGRQGDLKGYLRLYGLLEVSEAEAAAHARDLVRIVPDAISTVAGLAQRELRRADEAGALDAGLLAEVTEAVLFRAEKNLAIAQLGWLREALPRHQVDAARLLAALAPAFGHRAADVRQRAVRLLARHAGALDEAAREELAGAAEALPPELRGPAAEALGAPVAAAGPEAPPELAAPAAHRRMPPPIASLAELAEELAVLLSASLAAQYGAGGRRHDAAEAERVLAALVSFAHADRAALAGALRPVLGRYDITPGEDRRSGSPHGRSWLASGPHVELCGVVAAATGPVTGRAPEILLDRPWRGEAPAPITAALWERAAAEYPGPARVLVYRLREIATGLAEGPVPALLATPTETTGLLDPAVLLQRLTRAANGGWEPWELDLQQALLRLPPEPDPGLAERAGALGTPSGHRLAERLRWGDRDPAVARADASGAWQPLLPDGDAADGARDPAERTLATMLLTLPSHANPPSQWGPCWAATWPAHPDVIAACVVPHLRLMASAGAWPGTQAVLPLAEAPGPAGDGLATALALGLGAGKAEDRVGVTDALLTLAARGHLDGAALGTRLAASAACGELKLTRAVPALREAAEAGAHRQIWQAIETALPALLPPAVSKPPHRLGDLVALGTDLAGLSGARGEIPALTAFAAGRGSSLLLKETRRLRDRLAQGS